MNSFTRSTQPHDFFPICRRLLIIFIAPPPLLFPQKGRVPAAGFFRSSQAHDIHYFANAYWEGTLLLIHLKNRDLTNHYHM